jgi:5-methylcytosine-specific restriction endonuclease McrA
MTDAQTPTADQQLGFLQQLQLLFDEGEFSSTYKYALLLALGELAVEMGDDSGSSLRIPIARIAEKFAEFYWPQSAPYIEAAQDDAEVLYQNLGQQASVVNCLRKLRSSGAATLAHARDSSNWPDTIRQVGKTVKEMPLRYLQNVAGSTVPFLYALPVTGNAVELLPGVAFNLRRFQGFLQQLSRAAWTEHVRSNRRNVALIGQSAKLEEFLFGTSRARLHKVASILRPIQNDRCFFCQAKLHDAAVVDHFIPWSRYPRDTALNFVVSHSSCNGDKRELLAGRPHLERWLERNQQRGGDIGPALSEIGFLMEPTITSSIAKWAYQHALKSGGHLWLGYKQLEPATRDVMLAFSEQ